jgi:hypothetical protein
MFAFHPHAPHVHPHPVRYVLFALVLILVGLGFSRVAHPQDLTTPITQQDLMDDRLLPPVPSADPNIHWSMDARISAVLAFRINEGLCTPRVNVNTEQGRVFLTGSLPTEQMREQAIALAQSTPGVVGVQSSVIVQPGPLPGVPNEGGDVCAR